MKMTKMKNIQMMSKKRRGLLISNLAKILMEISSHCFTHLVFIKSPFWVDLSKSIMIFLVCIAYLFMEGNNCNSELFFYHHVIRQRYEAELQKTIQ
jgi:hypothetical protein